jgi:hypothetical protein
MMKEKKGVAFSQSDSVDTNLDVLDNNYTEFTKKPIVFTSDVSDSSDDELEKKLKQTQGT